MKRSKRRMELPLFSAMTFGEQHDREAANAHRRTVIVTGGAGAGIGSGITQVLAKRGWAVLIVDQDEPQLRAVQESLVAELCEVEALCLDVTSTEAPAVVVDHAVRKHGRLDGLVNNAGIGLCKPLAEVKDAEFERLLDVDFRAVFRFCRAAIPAMRSAGGSIVNIGSVHAHRTIRGYAVYSAIKNAIEALTRGLAVDYGAENVRVNCLHPGFVMSPQGRELIGQFTSNPEDWVSSYVASKQLLPELVSPTQVGNTVAFLLDPASAGITGQAITVDSGSSAMLYEREVTRR